MNTFCICVCVCATFENRGKPIGGVASSSPRPATAPEGLHVARQGQLRFQGARTSLHVSMTQGQASLIRSEYIVLTNMVGRILAGPAILIVCGTTTTPHPSLLSQSGAGCGDQGGGAGGVPGALHGRGGCSRWVPCETVKGGGPIRLDPYD